MSTPICKVWDDEQGEYVSIPAIRGPKGDPGVPGKTPVKGMDYWTAADKQEIVNSVIAALPDGTEVSY